jgi:S-(hydroxymethyl)glutathione dehydrogenase/alcohol dehydrogenase
MKALVFHKMKDVRVDTVKDPEILEPGDAIIQVTSTAICGSDLHIYNGFFPQLTPQVLGHEFMGIVVETGKDVKKLKKGDRVVVPFPIACGKCWFCKHGAYPGCEESNPDHYGPEGGILTEKGGGIFGYTDLYGGYDGGQAELVRVPFADAGPRLVPEGLTDEQILFTTDILPTGYSAIDWAGIKGGESVAIFGAGPVGLMAAKAARLRGAEKIIILDYEDYRLQKAKQTTDATTFNAGDENAIKMIRDMTGGRGADVCVDAVGMEAHRSLKDRIETVIHIEKGTINAMKMCFSAVRRGGFVSIMGAYGTHYHDFPVSQIFDKGLSVRTGQAPVHKYIDELIRLVSDKKVVLDDIITHTLPLSEAPHGYDIFNKKEDNCVKVVLKP